MPVILGVFEIFFFFFAFFFLSFFPPFFLWQGFRASLVGWTKRMSCQIVKAWPRHIVVWNSENLSELFFKLQVQRVLRRRVEQIYLVKLSNRSYSVTVTTRVVHNCKNICQNYAFYPERLGTAFRPPLCSRHFEIHVEIGLIRLRWLAHCHHLATGNGICQNRHTWLHPQ